MLQYRTNAGERRKPAIGLYGELTVEQARSLAQTWLAEVRRGGDPGGDNSSSTIPAAVGEDRDEFVRVSGEWRFKSRRWITLFSR
jgi:hypothetical protein